MLSKCKRRRSRRSRWVWFWVIAGICLAAATPAWLREERLRRMQPAPTGTQQAAERSRPVYRHSVAPGGVYSAEEAARAASRDRVVARHYAPVRLERLRLYQTSRDRDVYVSYRLQDAVYWTAKPVRIQAGESLLADGRLEIRARCGNRLSESPQEPTSNREPPPGELEETEPPPHVRQASRTGPGIPVLPGGVRSMFRPPHGPAAALPPLAGLGAPPPFGGPASFAGLPYTPPQRDRQPEAAGSSSDDPEEQAVWPEAPPGVWAELWPPPIDTGPAPLPWPRGVAGHSSGESPAARVALETGSRRAPPAAAPVEEPSGPARGGDSPADQLTFAEDAAGWPLKPPAAAPYGLPPPGEEPPPTPTPEAGSMPLCAAAMAALAALACRRRLRHCGRHRPVDGSGAGSADCGSPLRAASGFPPRVPD